MLRFHVVFLGLTFPGIRVEWAKSRARALRFTEEVQLLFEEMTCTLRHFEDKSAQWKLWGETGAWPEDKVVSSEWVEGHQAYAERQSAMYLDLRRHCADLWQDVPLHVTRMQAIIDNPSIAEPGEFDSSSSSKAKAKEARREARKV